MTGTCWTVGVPLDSPAATQRARRRNGGAGRFHVVGLLSEQWPDHLHTGVPIVPGRSGKAYATDCSFGPSPGPGVPEVLIDAERVDVGEPVRMRSAPGLTSWPPARSSGSRLRRKSATRTTRPPLRGAATSGFNLRSSPRVSPKAKDRPSGGRIVPQLPDPRDLRSVGHCAPGRSRAKYPQAGRVTVGGVDLASTALKNAASRPRLHRLSVAVMY